MTTKHKHYEFIMAWANGAEIEYFSECMNTWESSPSPVWNNNLKYRIRPEPKPDIVLCAIAYSCNFDGTCSLLSHAWFKDTFDIAPNIKLTYDAETKKLKAVELI